MQIMIFFLLLMKVSRVFVQLRYRDIAKFVNIVKNSTLIVCGVDEVRMLRSNVCYMCGGAVDETIDY